MRIDLHRFCEKERLQYLMEIKMVPGSAEPMDHLPDEKEEAAYGRRIWVCACIKYGAE